MSDKLQRHGRRNFGHVLNSTLAHSNTLICAARSPSERPRRASPTTLSGSWQRPFRPPHAAGASPRSDGVRSDGVKLIF